MEPTKVCLQITKENGSFANLKGDYDLLRSGKPYSMHILTIV